ncbi:MAG: response regulator transcription factor [Phaeodactylibacter sp.]|nr:response regulator transcription factor [Phaeodactylibacter sp.]
MKKSVIVDDNPMARAALRSLIRNIPQFSVARECSSAIEAYQFLQKEQADVLLLDVEMPDMSGLELLQCLEPSTPAILITSKPDYAVEAFGLKVLDYIVKPVSLTRLLQAFARLGDKHVEEVKKNYIFVREENTLVRIDLVDILFVEAMGDYVRIHTTARKHMVHLTMKNLLEKLPPERFYRCHRSYIVSTEKIESIAENMIVINKEVIPLSENYKQELMEKINLV